MWDSGKVESGESMHIEYDGKPLPVSCHLFPALFPKAK